MAQQQSHPVKEFVQSINDRTMQEIMNYLRLEDYDVFVRYIQTLGIRQKDTSLK